MEVEKDPERAKKDVQEYFKPKEGLISSPNTELVARTDSTVVAEGSSRRSSNQPALTFGESMEPVEPKDLSLPEAALPLPQPSRVTLRKQTWVEWTTELHKFLIIDGNWTDLAGTSLSWLALDFAYYCLSVNSPKILDKLWNTEANTFIYHALMASAYRALIAVSIGAVAGGALFIRLARHRWAIQVHGFWVLTAVFIIVGVCFVALLNTRYFAAVIVLYSVCSLFFNLGPNTSTYIIAAEVFPTRFRCTCHGISAAAGKLGSIIAQVFLAYAKFGSPGVSISDRKSTGLGWVLLIFTLWMACGAMITRIWVPNPVDIWGRNRTLEDLSHGKVERKKMEAEEIGLWRSFAPDSPATV